MVLTYSQKSEIGKSIPNFSLPATDGKIYSPGNFKDKKGLVIIFTCNHCPYAHLAKPKLHHLYQQYKNKDIQFVAINPNESENYPEDSFGKMKKKQYDYPFPYLRDESQKVAKAFGAVCTPDIFVYDSEQKLAYHGQLDDERPDDHPPLQPDDPNYTGDIKKALDTLVAGQQPDKNQKPAMGCSIKWRE